MYQIAQFSVLRDRTLSLEEKVNTLVELISLENEAFCREHSAELREGRYDTLRN